jgi:hypothetical protein
MGRVVTAISYAEDSEFAYMLKEMKRSDKNVSQTIVKIVERHMGLYDEVQRLNKRMEHLSSARLDHESAAKWLNLELEYWKNEMGRWKPRYVKIRSEEE